MIEIKNIDKRFGPNHVMKNLSVTFTKGDVVAIQGANGSGKTTFLRLLLGFYKPDKGSVHINSLDLDKNRKEIVENISLVPQMPPLIKLTLKDLLDFICTSSNVKLSKIKEYAALLDFDIEDNMKKSFYRLSGGMKQKFLISVVLAEDKDIMIFDEPTASMDIKSRKKFYEVLTKMNFSEKIILVIAHNSEFDSFINRIVQLDLGELVSDSNLKKDAA